MCLLRERERGTLRRSLSLGIYLHNGGSSDDGLVGEIGGGARQDDVGLALDVGGDLVDLVIAAVVDDMDFDWDLNNKKNELLFFFRAEEKKNKRSLTLLRPEMKTAKI